MQTLRVLAIATMLAFVISAQAQKPKSNTRESDHPRGEVEQMLEDANKRGEHIYQTCIDKCGGQADQKSTDGVEYGQAIELPQPEYPAIARAAHASGQVTVQVIIDTDGSVIAASATSGHPLLQAASVKAARDARFKPVKLNGQPVKVTGVILYSFTLN